MATPTKTYLYDLTSIKAFVNCKRSQTTFAQLERPCRPSEEPKIEEVIVCVGDTHAEVNKVNQCVRDAVSLNYNVVGALQVGDFGFYNTYIWNAYEEGKLTFDVPTLVIHGNHENQQVYRRALTLPIPNFKVAEPIEFVNMFGLNILCVGGALSIDKMDSDTHIPHSNDIYKEALHKFNKLNKPKIDLILTHEAPNKIGLKPNQQIQKIFNLTGELGSQELRDLITEVQPKLQINGHHHTWNQGKINQTECWTLPIPFCTSSFWNSKSGYGLINLKNLSFIKVEHDELN